MKVTTMDNFRYERKPSCPEHIDTFAASEDEWDTKEDADKPMKKALYTLRYAKKHLSD